MRAGAWLCVVAVAVLGAGCAFRDEGEPVPMELLRDASGTLRFEEARAGGYTPGGPVNIGYDRAAYWLRLSLRAAASGTYLLVVAPSLDRADAFLVRGARVEQLRTGSRLPYEERDVRAPSAAFRVDLTAGEPVLAYVRASSANTIVLAPRLHAPERFAARARAVGLAEGLFYGITLALVLFNLLLFVGLRDPVQLWYVVFQLGVAATWATLDEIPARFGLPGAERWLPHGEIVCVSLAAIGGVGFARAFLGTREAMPRADRALVGIAAAAGVLGASGMLTSSREIQEAGNVVILTWSLVMFVVGVLAVRRRARNAVFFLLAWSLLLAGTAIATLRSAGVFSDSVLASFALGETAPRIGSAVEAMVLALGLVVRVDGLRREKALAGEAVLAERAARTETLERLVGGVAHEIGNPLNFIVGGASALAGELPAGNARGVRALGVVQQGAGRIRRIVDNLRQYARARDVPLGATRVDEELAATLALAADRLERQRIAVVREIEGVPEVQARPGELGQVLANLVANACDAMPDGGTLRVGCTSGVAGVEVVVADSGPGVPEAERAAIFQPFFTTRAAGTGLGLAISAEIARRHGGELWLLGRDDPRAGGLGGAAFLLRVPYGAASPAAAAGPASAARQLATIFASIARRRPARPATGSAGSGPASDAA